MPSTCGGTLSPSYERHERVQPLATHHVPCTYRRTLAQISTFWPPSIIQWTSETGLRHSSQPLQSTHEVYVRFSFSTAAGARWLADLAGPDSDLLGEKPVVDRKCLGGVVLRRPMRAAVPARARFGRASRNIRMDEFCVEKCIGFDNRRNETVINGRLDVPVQTAGGASRASCSLVTVGVCTCPTNLHTYTPYSPGPVLPDAGDVPLIQVMFQHIKTARHAETRRHGCLPHSSVPNTMSIERIRRGQHGDDMNVCG